MPIPLLPLGLAVIGLVLCAGAVAVIRAVGASPAVARRLAGPPQVRVGDLLDGDLPDRALRIAGRIRCRDPLEMGDGERLVAFHRDVEIRAGRTWRRIERMRETRSFDLWDHDGSVALDPSHAADPLVTIPMVWRGSPDDLEEPHASAAARLVERHGPAGEARAITRTINVTDRLLVLARPTRDADGRVRLEPPEGGFVITNLELDDAMRLLGGRNRRAAAGALVALGVGLVLVVLGLVAAAATAVLG